MEIKQQSKILTFNVDDGEIFAFEELINFINKLHNIYLKETRINLNLESEKDSLIKLFKNEIEKENTNLIDHNVAKKIKRIRKVMGN